MNVNILLFENFTALDVFGPVEVLSCVDEYELRYFSQDGGIISNHQNIKILTEKVKDENFGDIWLIPGGWGTRQLVKSPAFLQLLKGIAELSTYCLSVCTGSALLAKCGALDGKRATSNKRAFEWVTSQSNKVLWEKEPRWVQDGKFYTSGGVSAGIDMAIQFVMDIFGREKVQDIIEKMEYKSNINY